MAYFFKVAPIVFILSLTTFSAYAYIGPGVGLTAFGCLAAVIYGFWFIIKGLFYIPVKHWITRPNEVSGEETNQKSEQQSPEVCTKSDK